MFQNFCHFLKIFLYSDFVVKYDMKVEVHFILGVQQINNVTIIVY